MFWSYKYGGILWDQCGEPSYEETMLLIDAIRKNRPIASFSDVEKRTWDWIEGRYAHASEDGYVVPDVLVVTKENNKRIHQLFCEHKNYEKIAQNVMDAYEKLENIFKKYSHQVLHNNLGYNIRMELYAMRMMAYHDLVLNGFLKMPDDPKKSSLGMHIMLG